MEDHARACPACAGERASLQRLLDAITPAAVFPREAEVDWSRPLTCQAVRADLSAYLRGTAGASGDGDLPAHLARCPACAEESAAISATLTAVRGAFPDEGRVDWVRFAADTARLARQAELAGGVAAGPALTGATPALRRTGAGARRARPWLRALPVAASLAAAAIIGYLTLGPSWNLQPDPAAPPTRTASLPAGGEADATVPAGEAAPDPALEDASPAPPAVLVDAGQATQVSGPGAAAPEASADPQGLVMVASDDLLRRTRLEMAKSDAARYLADSRNLLLSFTGLPVPCEGENVDVSVEREISSRLLRRKQFLDRDLQDVEVARARRVANEVESLLAEIALLENCVPPEKVREIRDLVGQRQLMMRIEMLTDELGPVRGGRA